MKKRLTLSLFAALALFVQGVTFAQVVPADRPTAQQLFDRCGAFCDPAGAAVATATKSNIRAAQTEPDGPIAMLRVVGGQIVGGTSAMVYMDIVRDLSEEVWVAGRVVSIVDGRLVPDRPFYVGRDVSLTRYGPGLFPGLAAGAVIPLGEVSVGNVGDEALLQVVLYDSKNGGRPILTGSTRLWSRIRPTRGVTPRVQVNSAEVLDGTILLLTGHFPKGERLIIEVGDPEWDSGFISFTADSQNSVLVRIPKGKSGGALYPSGWDGEVVWGIVVMASDGESFSFPGVLRVRGDYNRMGIFPAQ